MTAFTLDQVVELVDQLSPEEQTALTAYLLESARKRQLSAEEKIRLLRSAQIDVAVLQEPSIRREDWYGDDGR
jgi:hypothetical protein